MSDLIIKPIAHIITDFPEKFGVPRQSGIVEELEGKIVFENEFRDAQAVRCIEEFSHLWLIWGFSENKNNSWSATVRPPKLGGNKRVGVFASRSPFRPNPLGLSCVRLGKVDFDYSLGPVLQVFGADMVNNTPIYDIKPYISYSDSHSDASSGFSLNGLQAKKQVIFLCDVDSVPQKTVKTISDVLAQDPHPAYKHENERIYYMDFAKYKIAFSVDDECIYVHSVGKK